MSDVSNAIVSALVSFGWLTLCLIGVALLMWLVHLVESWWSKRSRR